MNTKIKAIVNKEGKRDLAQSFVRLTDSVNGFAHSMNSTLSEKFPEVFGMPDEEYALVARDVERWVASEEAYLANTGYQLEALTDLLVESYVTMVGIVGVDNASKISKKINRNITSRLEFKDEKQDQE